MRPKLAPGSDAPSSSEHPVYEATRRSLIEKLKDWDDHRSWDEFYKTYWRLIFSVGLKSGLFPEEATDLVQDVVLTIAKQQKEGRYDHTQGSFKAWLMNLTRWRITDQMRRRKRENAIFQKQGNKDGGDENASAFLENLGDPDRSELEKIWDAEWARSLTERALSAVRNQASPRQFQIFDCYVVKGWAPAKVTQNLGVSLAQVYLAKHRIGAMLRKEIKAIEEQAICLNPS